MKAIGKKRSKSQRIGVTGEDYFRIFAVRHRLLANKVEQDFGTDFICQVALGVRSCNITFADLGWQYRKTIMAGISRFGKEAEP